MPMSAWGRLAHDDGGGGGGVAPERAPAITVAVTERPSSSVKVTVGMSSDHSMVKNGSTILDAAGRLSQI